MSTPQQEDFIYLRDQLSHCSMLLKYSLKSNRPFDSKTRTKINDALAKLNESIESQKDLKERHESNIE